MIENILYKFSPISLQEMESFKLMDRVETKFVFSAKSLPLILERLSKDYRVVNIEDNLVAAYKTVYYDTESLYFYNEHHRKRKNRYKVRFRNYIDSKITYLEVKHKKNGRIDKRRIKVENETFTLDEQNKLFLAEANIDKNDLDIKLTNSYNRITLVANQSVERVTFDYNIQYHSHEGNSKLTNVVIAELKQPSLSRETPVYQVLRDLQIKPFSLSKYCIGIIKTYGTNEIKYNRFKKILLRINKISEE